MSQPAIPSQNPEALTHRHKPGPNAVEDSHGHEVHIVPVSVYLTIFGALMVLLVVTVGIALFDFSHFGPAFAWLNITIAVTIATVKAVLILSYFMHLKYSSKIVWLFAAAGFIWLVVMFTLGPVDYFTRSWLQSPGR